MDNYKLTPQLTLIAGLRYDFFTTVMTNAQRFSAFDPTLGLVPVSQLPGGHLYNAPKDNLGPALSRSPGLLRLTVFHGRQTVIRSGFGIYYDTIPLNNFEEGLAQNPVGPTAGVHDRSICADSLWRRHTDFRNGRSRTSASTLRASSTI